MRISRGLRAFAILAFVFPSLALGNNFDKTVPFNTNDLSRFTGEQLYRAALEAYVCSFLMHLAGQSEKGWALRSYSVKLMEEKRVTEFGKNWNDVNFPGALIAFGLSEQYSKRFNVPQSTAAGRLLNEHPKCAKY